MQQLSLIRPGGMLRSSPHTRTVPSSEAVANCVMSEGHQATAVTSPVCPAKRRGDSSDWSSCTEAQV
jgi:hypothetical protein